MLNHEPTVTGENLLSSNLPKAEVVTRELDLAKAAQEIIQNVTGCLESSGVSPRLMAEGSIRPASVLYMTYWYHRLQNNTTEQERILTNLREYIGGEATCANQAIQTLVTDSSLKGQSTYFVERLLIPVKTVDLVIVPPANQGNSSSRVLCLQRGYYPLGDALPGGIITEADEDNPFGIPAETYAGMRVAATKVLGLGNEFQLTKEFDSSNREYFLIRGNSQEPAVRVFLSEQAGYHFRENIKSILRPSDPRHIVDSKSLKCELIGEPPEGMSWVDKANLFDSSAPGGGLAFNHHRELISHITARTSLEQQIATTEREFIRKIIGNPLESYKELAAKFEQTGNSPHTSIPELFPVVHRLLQSSFTDEIAELCKRIPILAGVRDKTVIALRQVSLKNRTFCPYQPTLRAIFESVAFFDLVAREQRGFYDSMSKNTIVEHNPATTPNASYHMYRYRYRLDELMSMVPHQIIIPTFEPLSATDLMRVRGVPVFFIGLHTDFSYVDEFEQSPEEFAMHDANHSWRMAHENTRHIEEAGISKEQFISDSISFSQQYLESIRILGTDSTEQKEIKKLKKIILFEIVHEDARPFLRDTICHYIQVQEGNSVPFEVPRIDPETGYMDIVDTIDTGISTLSYVRNKLQHGFYDHVDAAIPQIVGLDYRTSEWIARAAYEMLVELNATPEPHTEIDNNNRVSYDWLLKRTCSVGPDNIHESLINDVKATEYSDGAERLNPKRYQV
jgi:hypothetical protein